MTLLACDLTLTSDMRLRLDEGRQNVVADEIRAHFHEIIALPAWERPAAIEKILKPRGVGDVRTNIGSGSR